MTPEAYIRKQCRRRRHGRIIPPIVNAQLVPYPVTTEWRRVGDLWSLGYHTGEDHAAPAGALVNSVSWGTVVCEAVWSSGRWEMTEGPVGPWGLAYGTHVVIRTADGAHDVAYCHLSGSIVRAGDRVRPGQTIGLSGATGHTAGAHLHLEARPAGGRFGSDVNPRLVKRMEMTP